MLENIRNRRSWITQRIANRYPPWSRFRQSGQSMGQIMIDPMCREIEDLYWWEQYNFGNFILNSSDNFQVESLRELSLPSGFIFDYRDDTDGRVYIAPESVVGQLSGGTWVSLTQADNNGLEELWYGVPTRITAAGESYSYNAVISSTRVSNISSMSPGRINVPGKLWLTLSENSSCLHNYRGNVVRSHVVLTGRDIHGLPAEERIFFAFNGTVQTLKAWSEIDSIQTRYIDDDAVLHVSWLPIGSSDYIDYFGLSISDRVEKFRFFGRSDKSYGTALVHKTFGADSFLDVEEGYDEKDDVYEIELLDSSESNVSLNWLTTWPKRRWVVGTTSSTVHFYSPDVQTGDRSLLADRDAEVIVQIYSEKEYYGKGDTIELVADTKRPNWVVLRSRWSVVKPNGTRVGINGAGSEVTYGESGWEENTRGTLFNRIGLDRNYIEYTLSQSGTYAFYLETTMKENVQEQGARVFEQTDVKIIRVPSETALASLSLPTSVGEVSYISFDSYGRPWVINETAVAHRLDFHYDRYIVDFTEKKIYVREDYDIVKVDS